MASNQDKITDTRNSARPNTATVSGTRSAGGNSLTCDNLAGWPTASKVHFVTYTPDGSGDPTAGTQLDCYGIVSGNTIGSMVVVDGTDNGNAISDVVEMLPTAAWGQDLADGLTEEHNRDGTHAAITATSLTATGNVQADTAVVTDTISEKTSAAGVTVDGLLIKDSKVSTAGSILPNNLVSAASTLNTWAWDTWTPTLSGRFTSGDWTLTECKYIQIGKTVFWKLALVASDSTPMGGGAGEATFTLPVTSVAVANGGIQIGQGRLRDATGSSYPAIAVHASTTTASIVNIAVSGANTIEASLSSTAPFTWTTSDGVLMEGFYEAA